MTRYDIKYLIINYTTTLEMIENAVKDKLIEIGNKKSAEILDMKKNTISMFTNNKRKFAPKMLFKIVEKIF